MSAPTRTLAAGKRRGILIALSLAAMATAARVLKPPAGTAAPSPAGRSA